MYTAGFEASSHYTPLMRGRWRCSGGGDFIYNSTLLKSLFSLCACASFPVLWKVLLSVGPRLTPTEAVNYQRWQHSFHLATITHIPQPPSKGLQSPTQVQGSCSVGTSWGGGVGWGGRGRRDGQASLSYASIHKRSTVRTSTFFMFPANYMRDGAKTVDRHRSTSHDKRGTTSASIVRGLWTSSGTGAVCRLFIFFAPPPTPFRRSGKVTSIQKLQFSVRHLRRTMICLCFCFSHELLTFVNLLKFKYSWKYF